MMAAVTIHYVHALCQNRIAIPKSCISLGTFIRKLRFGKFNLLSSHK